MDAQDIQDKFILVILQLEVRLLFFTSCLSCASMLNPIAPTIGILITNLGTPDAPTPAALRKYLAQFLSDPRVIETPRLLWWPVLHGIILRLRPRRSARAYREVWTEAGSPLLAISKRQCEAIRSALGEAVDEPYRVELGMRYGNPSIRSALEKLRSYNIRKLLVLPLYPQYSAATTASTFDAVADVLKTWRIVPQVKMITSYHDDPGYIDALAESIRSHWAQSGEPDKLLFSFHGLPRAYVLAGDPYEDECRASARLVARQLDLHDELWAVSFQSRFGPRKWLQPYTDKLLRKWGKRRVSHVQVICPGFAADCLETLEEIQIQNRDFFLSAGGKRFSYIPALNDHPRHIAALRDIIRVNL